MQVQSTTKKQSIFIKLNNLLNPSNYSEGSSSASLSSIAQKISLSQCATRENSKDSNSRDEEESIESMLSLDSDFQVEKTYPEANENSSSFTPKSNDEVRRSYINKLVNMKILDLQPKKKCQNISIFDWDDTLFCTSFLGDQPFHKVPAEVKSVIQILDETTRKILCRASRMSEVYIITNSDIKWVEQSAQLMLPLTYEVINRKNIKIISARKEYQSLFPDDLYRWKLEAFLSLKKSYESDIRTNMVVLGDSDLELRAAKVLGTQFKQAIVKTVKFEEKPSVEELIKQHRIVLNLFDEIFVGCKSMCVRLGKTQH